MKYYIYDLESTGLDVVTSEILEICIIDYASEEVVLHKYIYPSNGIIENSNIHGITLEKIKENNGITQLELVQLLEQFFQEKEIMMIAHNNNGYDQLLLEYTLKRFEKSIDKNIMYSDSLPCLRKLFKFPNYKLGTIYNLLFGNNNVVFHTAIEDTTALVHILKRCDQKELFLLLNEFKRPSFLCSTIKQCNLDTLYCCEYIKDNTIRTVYDLYDIYLILENDFISFLKNNLKIYSKFKIEKIIQQLNLIS